MEICINNYGIGLEIIGFLLLLSGSWWGRMHSNEINHKRPESIKKKISWWFFHNVRDVGIVLVISGLVMQLSYFNTC